MPVPSALTTIYAQACGLEVTSDAVQADMALVHELLTRFIAHMQTHTLSTYQSCLLLVMLTLGFHDALHQGPVARREALGHFGDLLRLLEQRLTDVDQRQP